MANFVAEDCSIKLERVQQQGLVAKTLLRNKLMHRSNPFDIESRCHNGHASRVFIRQISPTPHFTLPSPNYKSYMYTSHCIGTAIYRP